MFHTANRLTFQRVEALASDQPPHSGVAAREAGVAMKLTVLAVPGCPNAPLLEKRLAEVLAGRPGVTVQRRVITEVAEAARWGMRGSPTLLADGHDPFAAPGATPALACRLYLDEDGRSTARPPCRPCAGRWNRPLRKATAVGRPLAESCRTEVSAPGSSTGARGGRELRIEQFHRLHVRLLDPQDRLWPAEEHDPAVLSLHLGDVLERLPDDLLVVSVDHAVRSHRRYS
jgi:hypothetical protein